MPTELTPEEATEHFAQAQRIGEVVMSFFSTTRSRAKPWAFDRRSQDVDPLHSQTETGFFLEFYYSAPSFLWTPWGRWWMRGPSSYISPQYAARILTSFELELDTPAYNKGTGRIGPIYALYIVEGFKLPPPKKAEDSQNRSYNECIEAWRQLNFEYPMKPIGLHSR